MSNDSKKFKNRNVIAIIIFISIFLALFYYFLFDPIPFIVKEKFDHKNSNITQSFKINLQGKGDYLVGLYTAKNYELLHELKDGNYTIEYFYKDQLIKATKYEQNLSDEKDKKVSFENYSGNYILRLEQFGVPNDINYNDITIKITTNKQFSMFMTDANNKHKNYFVILKRGKEYYQVQNMFDDWMKEDAAKPDFKDTWDIKDIIEPNATKLLFVNALMNKDFETVKSMMENGSGIDVNTTFGLKGKFSIVFRKTNVPTNRTAIFYSAFVDDTKTLQYLIDKGSDLYHLDIAKNYALNYAIENSSTDAIKLFVKAGMDIDKNVDFVFAYKNPYNRKMSSSAPLAPLTYAVSIGDYNLTKTLLELNVTRMVPLTFKPVGIRGAPSGRHRDAYYFIQDISNYKEMLSLLLQYSVTPIKGGFGPQEENFRTIYDNCIKYKGEWCGEITEKLAYEDIDIIKYYDITIAIDKIREKRQTEKQKNNSQKGESNVK
ncbi:MAG: ankyrin repeat domain-containing protein [Campylobacteraceae bacterium]